MSVGRLVVPSVRPSATSFKIVNKSYKVILTYCYILNAMSCDVDDVDNVDNGDDLDNLDDVDDLDNIDNVYHVDDVGDAAT